MVSIAVLGKEGKAVYSLLLISTGDIVVSSPSTTLQVLIIINGNKMVSHLVQDNKSANSLAFFQGIYSPDCEACQIHWTILVSSCNPSRHSPLNHLHFMN